MVSGWLLKSVSCLDSRLRMMEMKNILIFFCLVILPAFASAQTTDGDQPTVNITNIKGAVPAATAHILKYYVDKAAPDSGYETGNLHIVYDDGTEVIEKVPPKIKSTGNRTVFNTEGFEDLKMAEDRRTISWTELVDNGGTSYAIPEVLAIYQSGKTVLHISQGQMVWYWTFRDGKKQIAAVWGFTHGPEVVDYQLYDVNTGQMISEVFGNAETQSLDANAPEWAKETEQKMHSQK
jgi:hypothetical protein